MVHALEIIREMLKRGGRLMDIHPSGDPPPIELLHGNSRTLLGYVGETDNFIEYAQADAAVAQAVANGWFSIEHQALFTFQTYADFVAELWGFLSRTWSDVILPDEAAAGEKETQPNQGVVVSEPVKISLLVHQDWARKHVHKVDDTK